MARLPPSRWRSLGIAICTYIAICFTWVFFRAGGARDAVTYCLAMLGVTPGRIALTAAESVTALSAVGLLLGWQWWHRDSSWEARWRELPLWGRAASLAAMLFAILVWSGNDRAFIYFQF